MALRRGDFVRSRDEHTLRGVVYRPLDHGSIHALLWQEDIRKFENWYTHENLLEPVDKGELPEEAVADWMIQELSR